MRARAISTGLTSRSHSSHWSTATATRRQVQLQDDEPILATELTEAEVLWLQQEELRGAEQASEWQAPRGLAVRGFYGRVAADHVSGLGILCGPPAPVAWSPARPERFSDLATARAAAVLALAEDPRNLRFGRLPTALVEAILACALSLFDD